MRKLGQHPAARILQLLHAHPWRCSSEISAALGFHPMTVNTTLTRLVSHGALISERRGRFVECESKTGYIKRLVCYAIAPIELKAELESNLSLQSIPDQIVRILNEKGGDVSFAEIRAEIPNIKSTSISNALRTLTRKGVIRHERDRRWSWFRAKNGKDQTREVEVHIYSLKENK